MAEISNPKVFYAKENLVLIIVRQNFLHVEEITPDVEETPQHAEQTTPHADERLLTSPRSSLTPSISLISPRFRKEQKG